MAHCLHDPLQHVDVTLIHGNQQRQRHADVQRPRNHPAPSHCARQCAARLLDLIAHDGSQFQAHQTEADHGKGVQDEMRIGRNPQVRPRNRRAIAQPGNQPEPNQRGRCNECPNPANVVDPLPDPEPDHIQHHQNRK